MKRMYVMVAFMVLMCAGMAQALDPLTEERKNADADRDGLPDLDEYRWATDPNNPDTDGAGAYDGWEVFYDTVRAVDKHGRPYISERYHFNPADPADEGWVSDVHNLIQVADIGASTLNDPDGDGWTNLHEFLVGTDPTNPNTDHDSYTADSADPDPLISNDNTGGGDPIEDDRPVGQEVPELGVSCWEHWDWGCSHSWVIQPEPDDEEPNGGGGSGAEEY